jgi:3-oxoacyl-[acyl-carrier-protein] synthase-1
VLEGATTLDILSYELKPALGHPVLNLTEGFTNVGRWLQLLPVAIEDVCRNAGIPLPNDSPAFWRETVADIVVPSIGERFVPDPLCDEAAMERVLATPLLRRTAGYFAPRALKVHPRGRVGVLECLQRASMRVARRECARVIIAAVDSLVDRPALQWLFQHRMMKSDDNPVGLSPGEAACAFILEPWRSARSGKSGAVQVVFVSVAKELSTEANARSSAGVAMAKVLSEVVSAAKLNRPFRGPLIADLNGQNWRANELGAAWTRVDRALVDTDALLTPLVSTGDTGSANCGVQLAVAHASLIRGYARSTHALVSVSEDDGRVGAVMLAREEFRRG